MIRSDIKENAPSCYFEEDNFFMDNEHKIVKFQMLKTMVGGLYDTKRKVGKVYEEKGIIKDGHLFVNEGWGYGFSFFRINRDIKIVKEFNLYRYKGRTQPFKLEAIQSFVNCKTMEDMFKAKYCMYDFMPSKSRLIDLIKPEKQIQGRSWPNPIYGKNK